MNFEEIVHDIKELKIQGATNVALAGLKAMKLRGDSSSLKKIINARPTEPCLQNAIFFAKETNPVLAESYLKNMDKKVETITAKLVKKDTTIFTHCHSTTVIGALKKAREKIPFNVNNTETRPLYQGRITAKELVSLRIHVNHYIDSGAEEAIRNSDIVFLGSDMITPKGEVYNKIGSYMITELAKKHKIPVYIITNSWKYTKKDLKIEERPSKEIWDFEDRNLKIINPAFEAIPKENITAIVSELGILTPKDFIKKVEKAYPWIK